MCFVQNPIFYPYSTVVSYSTASTTNTEASQRSRFTKEEDELLKLLVNSQKQPKWSEIALEMPNRTARQCRERYNNYLRPNLTNGPWTKEEDNLLLQLFERNGPKWSLISQSFNSRSAVNVKNHYACLVNQSSLKNRQSNNNTNCFLPVPETKETIENNENQIKVEEQQEEPEKDDYFDSLFSNFEFNNELWSMPLEQLPENDIFAY